MARRQLTDKLVQNLAAAPSGRRTLHPDSLVPGLAVSVTDRGVKTFVLYTRYPAPGGRTVPARRALGEVGALTLAEAREKARGWLALVARGVDPREEERLAREAAAARRAATFGAAAETYFAERVRKQRRGEAVEREMRRELFPAWRNSPLAEITRRDVLRLVEGLRDRPAPAQARNVLGYVRTFFSWAVHKGDSGLDRSPCADVKPQLVLGAKPFGQRVLSDDEIAALWRASGSVPYPLGPLYRLLLLTGQRLGEVAGARWGEFDPKARLWIVPPERFKSDSTHVVPLADDALALLAGLPRFAGGDAVFTTTGGSKAVNGFNKAKAKLDAAMTAELGREPARWTNHDIRRTVRTRLSKCRVPTEVAELAIGHTRKGLHKVYDQHAFLDERREALEAWEAALRALNAPPPDNVVPLRGEPAA